jgi:hypothetical protein
MAERKEENETIRIDSTNCDGVQIARIGIHAARPLFLERERV